MTPTDLSRLRVDQVGSLLRPAGLKEMFERHAQGLITEEKLRHAQDGAIREVVATQEAHRLPIVTDGEFRRRVFMESFADVAGFDYWKAGWRQTLKSAEQEGPAGTQPRKGTDVIRLLRRPATERLRLARNRPLEEYRFTRDLTARPVKVTLLGPDCIAQIFDYEHSSTVYSGVEEFLADVISVERRIVGELVEAGCRYVQFDEPRYTAYVDADCLADMRSRGEEPVANMERSIEADNAVIAGFPGVTFGLHICRGNRQSMWHREGFYDAIAERLFSGLRHQRLLLEYDTERAGGFEPLRFVPRGTVVVLGLITTKTGRVERIDELKRRVEAATRFIPIEQLALSPQCGFASGIAGNVLTEDEQWRKLDVMLEAAAQVWG